ncbi:unnamed protein product [Absidia cylindrospora]
MVAIRMLLAITWTRISKLNHWTVILTLYTGTCMRIACHQVLSHWWFCGMTSRPGTLARTPLSLWKQYWSSLYGFAFALVGLHVTGYCSWSSLSLNGYQDLFGWASFPLDLTQEFLSFLCIIGRLYTDFVLVLVVYWLLLGWGNSVFGVVIKSLVLDLLTSSCVDLSSRLVTFKDYFFGWASFPLDLTQELLSVFVHYQSSLY